MEDTPVVLTKATMDRLLKHPRSADLIALYAFYVYTGNWQKTNQPKATTGYAAKGLGWGAAKLRTVKAVLVKMGLIEDLAQRDPLSRKVQEWFIHVVHFPKLNTIHSLVSPEAGTTHSVAKDKANAWSTCNAAEAAASSRELYKQHEIRYRVLKPRRTPARTKEKFKQPDRSIGEKYNVGG